MNTCTAAALPHQTYAHIESGSDQQIPVRSADHKGLPLLCDTSSIAIEQASPGQKKYGMNEAMVRLYRQARCADDLGRCNRIAWSIVTHNVGLVKVIASSLYRQFQCKEKGLEFDDLMGAGYTGMRHAIRRFDPAKGPFSAYAARWISEYLKRYILGYGMTISMPDYLHYRQFNIRKAEDLFFNEGIENPSDRQIATRLGWSEREVVNARRGAVRVISLDAEQDVEQNTGRNGHNRYCAPDTVSPEETLIRNDESGRLRDLLNEVMVFAQARFSAQERTVLFLRYGIESGTQESCSAGRRALDEAPRMEAGIRRHGGHGQSLAEIGQLIGISRERVRQIEVKALGKIRKLVQQRYPDIVRLFQQHKFPAAEVPARPVQ